MLQDNKDQPVSFHEQMSEVENNAWQNRDEKNELKRRAAIRDDLYQHDLPTDRETVESVELEVERRVNGPSDAPYLNGDEWDDEEDTAWIWDQWIAEGYCNVLIAAQKTGKSTFFLTLVAELSKRTGSFLNFSFSEKKEIGFVLIGPDMNRRLWKDYGQKAGLLTRKDNGKLVWASSIKAVYTEETSIGLDPAGIKKIASHCREIAAQGLHPFVIADSYSALMANSHPNLDENAGNYTNPLRKLKREMSKEGATLLMIHHSSISGAKRDTATSASGHQNWGRVPDQILTLKWLQAEPGPDGTRVDNRVVLSATGRTGTKAKAQLLEQSPDWGWSSHGDTSDALRHRYALEQRDKLLGDDAALYDLLNQRTRNGLASTSMDLSDLQSTMSKSHWSLQKINRLCRKLERKSLAVLAGEKPPVGDMGGRPSLLWVSFEQFEEETGRCPQVHARPGSFEYGLSSSASETPINRSCSQNQPSRGGGGSQGDRPFATAEEGKEWGLDKIKPWTNAEKPPRYHESDDFPTANAIVEDVEGQPFQVLEAKPGAQILRGRDPHDRNAPIKERRWMMDVFPVGHKAKTDEEVLACLLDPDKEI